MSIYREGVSAADLCRALSDVADEYGGYIDKLEARVRELDNELNLLGIENNNLCDEIYGLKQQLEAVKACA